MCIRIIYYIIISNSAPKLFSPQARARWDLQEALTQTRTPGCQGSVFWPRILFLKNNTESFPHLDQRGGILEKECQGRIRRAPRTQPLSRRQEKPRSLGAAPQDSQEEQDGKCLAVLAEPPACRHSRPTRICTRVPRRSWNCKLEGRWIRHHVQGHPDGVPWSGTNSRCWTLGSCFPGLFEPCVLPLSGAFLWLLVLGWRILSVVKDPPAQTARVQLC